MPQTATLEIEGKSYPVQWLENRPPTVQELDEIEAAVRQAYGLKPARVQTSAPSMPPRAPIAGPIGSGRSGRLSGSVPPPTSAPSVAPFDPFNSLGTKFVADAATPFQMSITAQTQLDPGYVARISGIGAKPSAPTQIGAGARAPKYPASDELVRKINADYDAARRANQVRPAPVKSKLGSAWPSTMSFSPEDFQYAIDKGLSVVQTRNGKTIPIDQAIGIVSERTGQQTFRTTPGVPVGPNADPSMDFATAYGTRETPDQYGARRVAEKTAAGRNPVKKAMQAGGFDLLAVPGRFARRVVSGTAAFAAATQGGLTPEQTRAIAQRGENSEAAALLGYAIPGIGQIAGITDIANLSQESLAAGSVKPLTDMASGMLQSLDLTAPNLSPSDRIVRAANAALTAYAALHGVVKLKAFIKNSRAANNFARDIGATKAQVEAAAADVIANPPAEVKLPPAEPPVAPTETPIPEATAGVAPPEPPRATVEPSAAQIAVELPPAAPRPEAPPGTPRRDLVSMKPEDIFKLQDEVRAQDEKLLVDAFGEEGAKRYKTAIRQENSMDSRTSSEASAVRDQMEAALSPEMRNRIFGIGDTHYLAPEELGRYASKASEIDQAKTPDELGFEVSRAIADAKMTGPNQEIDPFVLFQIDRATKRAVEKGWDPRDIMDAAVVRRIYFAGENTGEILGMTNQEVAAAVERFRARKSVSDAHPLPARTPEPAVKSEAARPPEAPKPQTTPAAARPDVETMSVNDIGVDPRLQYKNSEITDRTNNVSNKLKNVDVYDRAKGGILTVWESKDGKRFALNAHHRRELAIRASRFVDSSLDPGKLIDVPREVPVRVLRESDGWTAEKARAYGAIENIADGKGTAFDAVGVMKDSGYSPETWREKFSQLGVDLSQRLAKHIDGLMKLPQDVMSYVRNGGLPEEFVAGVGAVDGLTAAEQRMVIESAYAKARTGDGPTTFSQGEQMAKRARGKLMQQEVDGGLFGGASLFGGDESFTSTLANLDKEAEIMAAVKRKLAAARSDLLKIPDEILDGESIDRQARQARAGKLGSSGKEAKDRVDFLFEHDRELSTKLDQLARDVVNGKITTAQAADRIYGDVADRAAGDLRQYIGRESGANPGVPESGKGSAGSANGSLSFDSTGAPLGDLNATLTKPGGRVLVDPLPTPPGGKLKKLGEMIVHVGKGTNVNVRQWVTRRKSVLGTYYPGTGKTAIRYHGDVDTAAHEIAHAMDDRYGLVSQWALPRTRSPFDSEILAPTYQHTASPSMDLAHRRAEGVAEWVRSWLVNPDEAMRLAPSFGKYFEETVGPRDLAALRTFSDDIRRFAGSKPVDIAMANVQVWTPKKGIGESAGDALAKLKESLPFELVNSLAPFEKAVRAAQDLKGKTNLRPSEDPVLRSRLYAGVSGKVGAMIEKGLVDVNMEPVLDSKTKEPITSKYLFGSFDQSSPAAFERDMQSTIAYMVSQRIREKGDAILAEAAAQASDPLLTPNQSRAIISNAESRVSRLAGWGGGIYDDQSIATAVLSNVNRDPALKARVEEGARRYREWSDAMLQYMVDGGRMSPDAAAEIRANNQYYVDMHRVMGELDPAYAGIVGTKIGSVGEPIKKWTGSTREIDNPYVSLMKATSAIVRETDRNRILSTFRELLQPVRAMYEGEPMDLSVLGREVKAGEPRAIRIFVNGKAEYWQFDDLLHKAIKGFGEISDLGPVLEAVAKLPALMREAVTSSPGFIVRNVARDTVDRSIMSEVGSKPQDVLKRIRPEDVTAMQLAGGDQAGQYLTRTDHEKGIRRAIDELAKGKKRNIILRTADAYGNLKRWSEMTNRQAEFRAAMAEGKAKVEAGIWTPEDQLLFAAGQARGLLDFAVAGRFIRQLNRFVPFTNAAIQGVLRTGRAIKDRPAQTGKKFLAYAGLAELVNYAWNAQDKDTLEEFRQQPAYLRDLFWNYKVAPDTWIRIPKGFEIAVAASGLSRAVDRLMGNEDALQGYGGSVARAGLPLDESIIAGPFGPEIQGIANYDFFRGRAIVPPYEQNRNLEDRKTDRASNMGQALQKVTQEIGIGIDARQLDTYIKARTGGIGAIATDASDIGRDRPGRNEQVQWLDNLLGIAVQSPAYSAPDVQWVLAEARGGGLSGVLEDEIDAFNEAKTPGERDAAARNLRIQATKLKKNAEAELRRNPGAKRSETIKSVFSG